MARVTHNGDLKEREKEKVHERNINLGEFVSYAYFNPCPKLPLLWVRI